MKSYGRNIFVLILCFLPVSLISFGGPAALFLLPLPVFFVYMQMGRRKGLVIILTALIISSMVSYLTQGKISNLDSLLLIALVSVVLGEMQYRRMPFDRTLFFLTLFPVVFYSGMITFQSLQDGKYPWEWFFPRVEKNLHHVFDFLPVLGQNSSDLELIRGNFDLVIRYLVYFSPALVIVGIAFIMWLNLLAAKYLFRRWGLSWPDYGDLSLWKPPENLVWFFIAGGIMFLIPHPLSVILGGNILIICLYVYLMAGVAIVYFFLKKANLSLPWRILIYSLIFFQQFVTLIVSVIGLFDLWVNFRRLNKKLEDTVSEG